MSDDEIDLKALKLLLKIVWNHLELFIVEDFTKNGYKEVIYLDVQNINTFNNKIRIKLKKKDS